MQKPNQFVLHINPKPEANSLFTREGIDIINSICWLLMDALWMFNLPKVGLLFGIPTLLTGWLLFYRDQGRSPKWIMLATNCWILMNILWMMSDTFHQYEQTLLIGSKASLFIGMLFVAIGTHRSGNLADAIAHYKKYKSIGEKRLKLIK